MASHRTESRRKTLIARLLAVAGVAGVVGVVLMSASALSPEQANFDELGQLKAGPVEDQVEQGVDAARLTKAGILLASMAVEPTAPPAPVIEDEPEPDPVPDEDPTEVAVGEDGQPVAAAAPARYRFLGVIESPDGPLAFITDEEAEGGPRQNLVGRGRQLNGLTVDQVRSDHVMFRDSADRLSRVELAAQTTRFPTAAPATPARTNPNRANGRGNSNANTPSSKTLGGMDRESLQMRNELLAGRIDPEEAQILHQKGIFDDATMRQYERLQEQRERRAAAKDAARRRGAGGASAGKEK